MACHTATHGKDALCNGHTAKVFGRGLDTHENDFLFLLCPCFRIVGKEYDLAGSGAWRCGKTLGHYERTLKGGLVEHRVEKLVEFLGLHTQKGGLFVDFTCAEKIHGDFHHSGTCTLAVTGLEHPEFAILDGELHVLHILVVVLKLMGDADKLCGTYGHSFLKRGIFCSTILFRDTLEGSPTARALDGNLLGCTDTGNHILALGVDEVFAVEYVFTGGGITRERHAGSGVVTHVTVNHSLHVDSGSPFFGNLVHATVEDCTLVHPAVEHGADTTPQLIPCAFGEVLAGVFLNGGFEEGYKVLEVFDFEIGIEFHTLFLLHLVDDGFEGVGLGFRFGLHAKNHVAVHLHETAVAVPCETGVAALFSQSVDSGIVHTEV